jgi:nucleoside-diphosphate-sugar epimerase
MLMTANTDDAYGKVFNVGTGDPVSFIGLAKKIVEIAGAGRVAYTEFTRERKEVEPGDYYADVTRIKNVVNWTPKVSLDEGIQKTIAFYRKHKKEYW